jgi:SAM-dependent methyltransferase
MELPRENPFGHSKKVRIISGRIAAIRAEQGQVSVLDLGCGNGSAVTQYIGRVADRVLGLDFHLPSVEYANSHFGNPHVKFERADVTTVSGIADFDVAILADVLEHVKDPGAMLRLAVESVKPGGLVFVTIPNGAGPFEAESSFSLTPAGRLFYRGLDALTTVLNRTLLRDAWTRSVTASDIPYNIDNRHVNFFREADMLSLSRQAGLQFVRRINLAWLSGPYTNTLLAPFEAACDWNAQIADKLPASWVSAWLFEFKRVERSP